MLLSRSARCVEWTAVIPDRWETEQETVREIRQWKQSFLSGMDVTSYSLMFSPQAAQNQSVSNLKSELRAREREKEGRSLAAVCTKVQLIWLLQGRRHVILIIRKQTEKKSDIWDRRIKLFLSKFQTTSDGMNLSSVYASPVTDQV